MDLANLDFEAKSGENNTPKVFEIQMLNLKMRADLHTGLPVMSIYENAHF